MLNQQTLLIQALHSFSRHRSSIKEKGQKIQILDNEYTLIHSFIENLIENKRMSIRDKEDDLKDYLMDILNGENEKIESKELIDMVKKVCEDLGFIKSSKLKL